MILLVGVHNLSDPLLLLMGNREFFLDLFCLNCWFLFVVFFVFLIKKDLKFYVV